MHLKRWLIPLGLFLLGAGAPQALMLGGVDVPKEKIIVYLLIGHSNMAGHAVAGPDAAGGPRQWNYQWFSTKKWVAAKETPSGAANGLGGQGEGGPGMSILKDLAAKHPDYNIGVVENAKLSATCHGTNLGSNSSNLPADSNRYWKGITLYTQIVTAAKEIQKDVTLGGIICMLGTVEATRTSDAVCRNFGIDIAQMATDMRNDLGNPNIPFIIGEYEHGASGDFALTNAWPQLVDAGIKSVPSLLPLSASVNSVGIEMMDDHHYSTNVGELDFAKRVVDTIESKKWFPPPSGASFVRGLVSGGSSSTQGRFKGPYFLAGKGSEVFSRPSSGWHIDANGMATIAIGADGRIVGGSVTP